MKKILSILLATLLILALAACGGNAPDEEPTNSDKVIENQEAPEQGGEENADLTDDEKDESVKEEVKKEETKKEDSKKEEPKKEEPKKESVKNETVTPAPETKPETKPEELPQDKPEAQPEPEKAPATLGNTLLADFKAKANAGMSTLAIAEGLMQNEAILFSGGAMEVEPGLLSGFDNTEITGFKSGAVFMPMIGSIAFIGYVFELEDASAAPAFIANLKNSANMRWNICVEAEEMVTGSVGNKVFFVMCPKALEE